MRKISEEDVRFVVGALRAWRQRPLSWNGLRAQISTSLLNGAEVWSRQSLQANESIRIAWLAAKQRLAAKGRPLIPLEGVDLAKMEKMKIELHELQVKYDNLAIRHRQLLYNASLLPGGVRLLVDPLPDNTSAQQTDAGNRKSRRT